MTIHTTIALRALKVAEANLSELDGPLAVIARRHIHEAVLNVDTMRRLEERKCAIGERGEAA